MSVKHLNRSQINSFEAGDVDAFFAWCGEAPVLGQSCTEGVNCQPCLDAYVKDELAYRVREGIYGDDRMSGADVEDALEALDEIVYLATRGETKDER